MIPTYDRFTPLLKLGIKAEQEKLNTSLAAAFERHRQGCYEEVSTISKILTVGPLAQTDATSSNVPSSCLNFRYFS